MLGDEILIGTLRDTSKRRRIILFEREVLEKVFGEAPSASIGASLMMPTNGGFLKNVLDAVIGQISYSLNQDKKSWRVTSVSSQRRGLGTELYKLAMADVYPEFLTPDASISDIGNGPIRIWEKISQIPKIEKKRRTDLIESKEIMPVHLFYGYRQDTASTKKIESFDLSRPNTFTIRLWEETDGRSGWIGRFWNEIGYNHFMALS